LRLHGPLVSNLVSPSVSGTTDRLITTLKVRAARLMTHPRVGSAMARAFGDRIPHAGTRVCTAFSQIDSRTKAALFFHLYERAELTFIRKYVPVGATVLELGSSLGISTLHIARAVGPTGRVVAVEADPALHPITQRVMADNRLENVELIAAAVSTEDAPVVFARGRDNRTGALDHRSDSTSEDQEVQGYRLSTLLARAGIDGPYVLISDVEGAEHSFIENDPGALSRCALAVLELHDLPSRNRTWSEARDALLRLHGFQLLDQRGPVAVVSRQDG
jgi:FkbM family methyltransferase